MSAVNEVNELKEALKRVRKEGHSLDLLAEQIVRKCAAVCREVAEDHDWEETPYGAATLCAERMESSLMRPPDE